MGAHRWSAIAVVATVLMLGSALPASAADDIHLVSKLAQSANLSSGRAGAGRSFAVSNAAYDVGRKTSTNGRYALFMSEAPDVINGLVGVQEFKSQLYVRDRVAQTTTLISHKAGSATNASGGNIDGAAISADGEWVVFSSTGADLVADQNDPPQPSQGPNLPPEPDVDVFLWHRSSGATTLVTRAAGQAANVAANEDSRFPSISADGRHVVFHTQATNLVAGVSDSNPSPFWDVYSYDRQTDTMTLVTHTHDNLLKTGNGPARNASISDDGQRVVFQGRGTDYVAGQVDAGVDDDIFMWERSTGALTLVSRTPGSPTSAGNGISNLPRISSGGTAVLFHSRATDLITGFTDGNGADSTDLYVWKVGDAAATLISRSASSATTSGNGYSEFGALSADGSRVAFHSFATNLVPGQVDSNNEYDVFAYDVPTSKMRLLSRRSNSPVTTTNQNDYAFGEHVDVNAAGTRIAFSTSGSDVLAGVSDTNGGTETQHGDDVYLFSWPANQGATNVDGTLTLVSHAVTSSTTTGAGKSMVPKFSPDGSVIIYQTDASNLTPSSDSNDVTDAIYYDVASNENDLLSAAFGSVSNVAGRTEGPTSASDDGRYVAFTSPASKYLPDQSDANGATDVFLYDTRTRTTRLVSHVPSSELETGNGRSEDPVVSGDGSWVAFTSSSRNLVAGFTFTGAEARNVFLWSRATGAVRLVSHTPGSTSGAGDGLSENPSISDDGSRVAFESSASNLTASQGEAAGDYDVFTFDRPSGAVTLASHVDGGAAARPERSSSPIMSGSGNRVVFANYVGSSNFDIFAYNVSDGALTKLAGGQCFPAQYDISDDGQRIPFVCLGSASLYDFGATPKVKTLATGVSMDPTAGQIADPEISGDGSIVAFRSPGAHVSGQTSNGESDVFLYDIAANQMRLVSHIPSSQTSEGNGEAAALNLSANGQYLAFVSEASNLVTGVTDPNVNGAQTFDAFMYEVATRKVVFMISSSRSSDLTAAGLVEQEPTMSDGGHVVTFISRSGALVADDGNLYRDAFASCFPELTVSTTESRDPVIAGHASDGTVKHTTTVQNSGPCYASGITVSLTETLPGGVTRGTRLASRGTVNGTTWTIPALEPGQTATLATPFTASTDAVDGSVIRSEHRITGTRQRTLSAFDDVGIVETTVHLDTQAPTVIAKAPTSVIPVTGAFTARFSELVEGVSSSSMYVRAEGSTTNLAGTVATAVKDARTTATWRPAKPLTPGRSYTIFLTSDIHDPAGNALEATSWQVRGGTLVQNTSPALLERWDVDSHRLASGRKVIASRTAGSSATLTFTVSGGQQVSLHGLRLPAGGNAEVWIDGKKKATVSTYSPTPTRTRLYRSAALTSGQHTLKIRVLGTKPRASRGAWVSLDNVTVGAKSYEESALGQTFRRVRSAGAAGGSYDITEHVVDASGRPTYTLKFWGTGINVYATKLPSSGRAAVSVDGASVGNINLAAKTTKHKALVFSKSLGSAARAHTITIACIGTPTGAKSAVAIDYFTVN